MDQAELAEALRELREHKLRKALAADDIEGFNAITAEHAKSRRGRLEGALRRGDTKGFNDLNAKFREDDKGITREPNFNASDKRKALVQEAEDKLANRDEGQEARKKALIQALNQRGMDSFNELNNQYRAEDASPSGVRAALVRRAEQRLRQRERERVFDQVHSARRRNRMLEAEEGPVSLGASLAQLNR